MPSGASFLNTALTFFARALLFCAEFSHHGIKRVTHATTVAIPEIIVRENNDCNKTEMDISNKTMGGGGRN